MSRRGYVRAARVCVFLVALMCTYLLSYIPMPPRTWVQGVNFGILSLLALAAVFVFWKVSSRPRRALYVQAAAAAYGVMIIGRSLASIHQISMEETRPAVVLSFGIVLLIGILMVLGCVAVWMVDRDDHEGMAPPPLPGA